MNILEKAAFQDSSENVNINLAKLNKNGVSIWIDDFGIGYSTVSILQHSGVHGIKIDRRFVCNEQSD